MVLTKTNKPIATVPEYFPADMNEHNDSDASDGETSGVLEEEYN